MNESWHKYINSQAPRRSGKDTVMGRQRMLEMLSFSFNSRYLFTFICSIYLKIFRHTTIQEKIEATFTTATSEDPHVIPLKQTGKVTQSYKQLKKQGFKLKSGYSSVWEKEEKDAVSDFMRYYIEHSEGITYPDMFSYISRKILDGSKSRDEVKWYLVSQFKQ